MTHRAISKSLSVVLVALVLASATWSRADTAADKRTAGNRRLDTKTRIEACAKLLATEGLSATERTWALMQRASLYRYTGKYDKALADFDKAEKLDPTNPRIYQGRAEVYFNTKRYALTETELTKALKLDPRRARSWYVRARARVKLKKTADAMKDYDKALALSPRYFSAYSGRGRLHICNKEYKKAIKDCDGALALDPYYAGAYAVRGAAYEAIGKPKAALHDQAIAFSLNPNLQGPEPSLRRLTATMTPAKITTDPIAYKPPKKGLSVAYLMTLRFKQPKKSDMEAAIGDLAGWFKKARVHVPRRKRFLIRKVTANKDGMTTVTPSHKYHTMGQKPPPVTTIDYYRTMWAAVFPMGKTGQVLTIELDRKPLDALWPLKVGNKGTGTAKLVFVGPDPLTPMAKFMGCKKPGDRIPFGQMKWTGGVVGREKIVVPAGIFETVVIRFTEEMEVVMLGKSRKNTSVVTWWYAPSVRWWVKRTRDTGGDLIVDEAEEIK